MAVGLPWRRHGEMDVNLLSNGTLAHLHFACSVQCSFAHARDIKKARDSLLRDFVVIRKPV